MADLIRHTHEHQHLGEKVDCYQEHSTGTFTHVGSHVHEGLGPHNHQGQGHSEKQLGNPVESEGQG